MTPGARTRLTVLGLCLAGAMAAAGSAQAAPQIPLNTGQEVPDPTSRGAHGSFSYEIEGDTLCYSLSVSGLSSPALAAHIHVGPRNVAGPVVVPLGVEADTSFDVSACTTADPETLAAIEASPKDYYVNVHTATNPPGEIRGQLK